MLLLRIGHRIEPIDVTLYLPIYFMQFLISIHGRSRQYTCNVTTTCALLNMCQSYAI